MTEKLKKGLGTGLSALFGEDIMEDDGSGELLNVPLTKVEPRAEQPRNHFDEKGLQELSDSIEQYGLIQPITVRRLDSGYYQIIAGERRWRAARMAGLTEVPVRVISADDRRTAELALVENLQREDLNPIEEALGFKSLIEDYGLTQEEAAKSVGRSRPAITNSLRLLTLGEDITTLIKENKLSAGHARALIPLPEDKQYDVACKVMSRNLSVRKTEELVSKTLKEPKEKPKSGEVGIDYAADTAQWLTQILSRKVSLKLGKKGGKIELEFYDSDDREALIENLARMGNNWEVTTDKE